MRITTDQNASAGIMGVIERMMTPLIAPTMRRLYLDELGRLESLAQRWPGSAPTSSR